MRARFLSILLVGLFASTTLFAQVAADPYDYFYDDLVVWETMGLVNNLPAARPYPQQLVKSILDQVIAKGDATQRQIAEAHAKRIFGRVLTVGYKTGAAIDSYNGFKQLDIALAIDLNFFMSEKVSASVSVDGWATNKLRSEELIPAGQGSAKDIVEDNAKAGPMWILPSVNSSIAIGTPDYYLNAGLMRGSWGPFHYDGIIVGPQALHTGQLDFAFYRNPWGLNVSFYTLSATADDDPDKYYPEKFVSIHSIDYHPYEWLSVSILESVIYGGRFDPLYILPLSPYMISQGNTGFADNNYIGGMFTVKPIEGLKIDGVLNADDLSFNDLVKLKFDTKWRIAGQIGASYAPRKSGLFTLISLNYTMVTPYTYSHKGSEDLDTSEPNYQNYTQAGESFGAALDPNSDRINLKIKIRPLEDVDVDFVGTLIRHANVNEDIGYDWVKEYLTGKGSYVTDGSIRNSSGSDAGHAYFYSTPFLTQETIQYIWQTGFDVACRLPILKTGGHMLFKFGYRFEMNINPDVTSEIYAHDESLEGADDETIKAAAAKKLANWREDAVGTVYNNYISAGFQYFF
ncbi:MAG TPA: hypothetical protein PK542_05420 [Treponemataceae bacterium]|nr:hypothetical protein [Treponemataceae bacterium]HPS43905.1 hypothetical protein [Treponemataceae bacterium]